MSEPGRRKWWALGAVSLTVLAVSLDGTVLTVALPTLATSLHAPESSLQWFTSGYLLMLAAFVLPAGLLGDRYGRKRLLLASLALFGVGSLLCGYAPSPAVFLIARLITGVAGAGVTVMALSALTVLFTDRERGKAVGIYEAANFLALPIGPILGGWMLSRVWWGWVFLLNVPVVLVGLAFAAALVPESRSAERPTLDWIGIVASTGGLVVLTYGLIDAGERGWTDPASLALIVAGPALLGGFFAWQRRLAGRGGQPLVDPALFRSRSFTWGAVLSGTAGLCLVGLLFLMPQYFQAVQGAGTFGSGLRLLPLVGGLIIGAIPAGPLGKVIGTKLTVALGFALVAAGAALGATSSATSGTAFVAGWMLVLCAGVGLALTAATAAALAQLSADRSGIGSAVVQACQKTSAPLGAAIMGSVASAEYRAHLDLTRLPATAAATTRRSVYAGLQTAHRLDLNGFAAQVRGAFTAGLTSTLVVTVGIAILGMVLTGALLPRGHAPAHTAEPLVTDEVS